MCFWAAHSSDLYYHAIAEALGVVRARSVSLSLYIYIHLCIYTYTIVLCVRQQPGVYGKGLRLACFSAQLRCWFVRQQNTPRISGGRHARHRAMDTRAVAPLALRPWFDRAGERLRRRDVQEDKPLNRDICAGWGVCSIAA